MKAPSQLNLSCNCRETQVWCWFIFLFVCFVFIFYFFWKKMYFNFSPAQYCYLRGAPPVCHDEGCINFIRHKFVSFGSGRFTRSCRTRDRATHRVRDQGWEPEQHQLLLSRGLVRFHRERNDSCDIITLFCLPCVMSSRKELKRAGFIYFHRYTQSY